MIALFEARHACASATCVRTCISTDKDCVQALCNALAAIEIRAVLCLTPHYPVPIPAQPYVRNRSRAVLWPARIQSLNLGNRVAASRSRLSLPNWHTPDQLRSLWLLSKLAALELVWLWRPSQSWSVLPLAWTGSRCAAWHRSMSSM